MSPWIVGLTVFSATLGFLAACAVAWCLFACGMVLQHYFDAARRRRERDV